MKTFKEYLTETTKEMTLKQVMKKINDGYWEAEQDMKVGRHAILRDTKTNKRITVYIKEDLNEGLMPFKKGEKVKFNIKGNHIKFSGVVKTPRENSCTILD